MTDNNQRKKNVAKIAPSKPHSIYAWFVGLPLGILIVLSALTIFLWKVAIPAYVLHKEQQEAEKATQEHIAAQQRVVELMTNEQKRLDREAALSEKQALEARELEKRRLENEIQK
jgi:hypothetical protein